MAFFAELFAARRDAYAVRWENPRLGKAGWMPAVAGGWRRGMASGSANLLPLTPEVVASHLVGDLDLGLYPLLVDDSCHWLAADFDGPAAMLDALAYLKAARAVRVPAVLEASRSGTGAHAWIFFAVPVLAAQARRLGLGLLREAMAIRGRMSLASYDRLFPAQDVLPAGGFGNLIAAPLQGRCRRSGTTVFLDLATMEPHDDQWAFLSTVDRMAPRDVTRALGRLGEPAVGTGVRSLSRTDATRIRVPVPREPAPWPNSTRRAVTGRSWRSRPVPTSGKGSTAPPWTRCPCCPDLVPRQARPVHRAGAACLAGQGCRGGP